MIHRNKVNSYRVGGRQGDEIRKEHTGRIILVMV